MSVPRMNLIGAGRVGQTLGALWARHGALQVHDVLTTSPASAERAVAFMGQGRGVVHLHEMRPAHLWMLAVPDAAIADCAQALAQAAARGQWAPVAVFHLSGALTSARLAPLADQGWTCASAHCLLSFATPQAAINQFAGTPCALEGDPSLCARLTPLWQAIGGQPFTLAGNDKLLYHAGAVFATNFLPVLHERAQALWEAVGMPSALAQAMPQRLARQVLDNVQALGARAALTGPAARADHAALARQGAALARWDSATAQAYASLNALALRMAGHAPMPPPLSSPPEPEAPHANL